MNVVRNNGIFRKATTKSHGREVTLEQVGDRNAPGTVYVIYWGGHLRLNAWGYGRGDSTCMRAMENDVDFQEMADDYIKTLARKYPSIIKEVHNG